MLIIQGSSRSDGNTGLIANHLNSIHNQIEVLDLLDFQILDFSYEGPGKDDFEKAFDIILAHDVIIWLTPIYWYAMSGVMKRFLDRFSDLLIWDKDKGRQLRGKKMAVISCSGEEEAPDFFIKPFELTSRYLGMEFLGHHHVLTSNKTINASSEIRMDEFLKSIIKETGNPKR